MALRRLPNEGDIYKVIRINENEFVIRYGYYTDSERASGEPMPILPDFSAEPMYDKNGYSYATRIQDACKHYESKNVHSDMWCADCKYFSDEHADISICRNENNKQHKEDLV